MGIRAFRIKNLAAITVSMDAHLQIVYGRRMHLPRVQNPISVFRIKRESSNPCSWNCKTEALDFPPVSSDLQNNLNLTPVFYLIIEIIKGNSYL